MASNRYYQLPQEDRPSIDINARDDERLLGQLDDDGTFPRGKSLLLSFHPTLWARLFVFLLLFLIIIFLINSGQEYLIPFMIVTIISILRHGYVILRHLFSPCVRIRLEYPRKAPHSPNHQYLFDRLSSRTLQICFDTILWFLFFLAVTLTGTIGGLYRFILVSAVLGWVATPFFLLSVIDGGEPSSVTIALERVRKPNGGDRNEPSKVYRSPDADVIDPRGPRSGADSPVVV